MLKHKGSLFEHLLANPTTLNDEYGLTKNFVLSFELIFDSCVNRIFIDRDPDLFREVLNIMTYDTPLYDELIQNELEYFNILKPTV